MVPHEQLHLVYTIICIILLLSFIFHYCIYKQLRIPYDKLSDKKDYAFYMNKAHEGMIRGVIFAIILDGSLIATLRNGAIYGTINPLISYIGIS